jgi:DNA polymerase III delta prime subunit
MPQGESNMLLVEKYRPNTIDGFIGIEDARADMADFVADPYSSAWLFCGKSGLGKTTLAMAVAAEMGAQVHHIPSQSCTVDTVKNLRHTLAFKPLFGARWSVVIVDEADEMSAAAENAWLSLTDSTNRPVDTVIIFTCNETEKLKDRFLSRCELVRFSSEGVQPGIARMLAKVWADEMGGASPAPNFATIAKDAKGNVRESLQVLQKKIRRALRSVEE